jgi:hypothetical protein
MLMDNSTCRLALDTICSCFLPYRDSIIAGKDAIIEVSPAVQEVLEREKYMTEHLIPPPPRPYPRMIKTRNDNVASNA